MNETLKKLILSLSLVVAVLFVLFYPRQNAISGGDGDLLSAVVQRGELEISIHTIGVIDAAKSHMMSSDIRGNKGKIISLVRDGSWVEKGEILVRLDPSPFEEEVHRLQGKVESLEAAVQASEQLVSWEKNQVSQNIAAREYDLKVARLDLERLVKGDGPLQLAQYEEEMGKAKAEHERYASFYKELKKLDTEGFNNPAELERAKENATTYREKFAAAKRRFDSYRDYVLPSMEESAKAKVENSLLVLGQEKQAAVYKTANAVADLNQAKAQLNTVKGSLDLARAELANTVLRAPFAGIAILYEAFRDGQKRKPREGDTVLMHQPILYLPDITKLIVRTKVREVDLHKVEVGQQASVLIDAYPNLRFPAEVQFVGALASGNVSGNSGGKYFQVMLGITGQDMRLRPGMTARVLIQAETGKDVLLLPVQAVFQDNNGRPYCYLLTKSGTEPKKTFLKLGRENEMQVEVLSGLEQGDRVSLVAPHSSQ
ncbi:MAG TPA: efflux RND transporter periplasmic adaptor subunit [Desulfobacterales bacterium]|nr:efflux RND transporter periplasmic adaptor subunit [Desulfobacterales bacterium]HIP38429.1 efflux RND transporter periplasmic adaptor subunit [Desulfocapsa sulfexigens]